MRGARRLLSGTLIVAWAATAAAQTPDLSGTWTLDAGSSRVTSATLGGLIKAGAPETLHITHAANGTVVVESQVNESQSRLYVPNAKTTTPVVPSGSITMTTRWDGRKLVSEGFQESLGGEPVAVKEVFAVGADTRTLTIEISTTVGGTTAASTLVYVPSSGVQPCQKWPTPCK